MHLLLIESIREERRVVCVREEAGRSTTHCRQKRAKGEKAKELGNWRNERTTATDTDTENVQGGESR